MLRFAEIAPDASLRLPFSQETFTALLFPALLCYYVMAVLAQLPDTIYFRLALLPLSLWTAVRAATTLDFALPYNNPDLVYLNYGLCIGMIFICMRVIEWAFCREPLKRLPLSNGNVSGPTSEKTLSDLSATTLLVAAWDAVDLICNFRGLGWNWSRGLRVPEETRPTLTKTEFVISVSSSFLKHLLFFDSLHYTLQWLYPYSIGTSNGGSILDESLSPVPRFLQSSAVTLSCGFAVYAAIQIVYDFNTLVGIVLFRQRPSQWPPASDTPWKSTSLTEFWALRWHQSFRRSFIVLGAQPMSWAVGRVGSVLGAFFMSGVLHDWGMWGMGKGTDFWSVGGFFLMMGVGIILEHLWRKVVGTKVCGRYGWIWMMIWTTIWAHLPVDAWFKRGLVGSQFLPNSARHSRHWYLLLVMIEQYNKIY